MCPGLQLTPHSKPTNIFTRDFSRRKPKQKRNGEIVHEGKHAAENEPEQEKKGLHSE